jgi:hypothetical protein
MFVIVILKPEPKYGIFKALLACQHEEYSLVWLLKAGAVMLFEFFVFNSCCSIFMCITSDSDGITL